MWTLSTCNILSNMSANSIHNKLLEVCAPWLYILYNATNLHKQLHYQSYITRSIKTMHKYYKKKYLDCIHTASRSVLPCVGVVYPVKNGIITEKFFAWKQDNILHLTAHCLRSYISRCVHIYAKNSYKIVHRRCSVYMCVFLIGIE